MNDLVIAGTGMRPVKIGGYQIPNPTYNWIFEQTENILSSLQPKEIISGAALGFDQLLIEVAIKLNIPFIAAVPFLGQEKMWPEASQEKYHALLTKAHKVHIVCKGGYDASKMMQRNIWMIDHANLILACWNGSRGGTGNAVKYTVHNGKNHVVMNPFDKKTSIHINSQTDQEFLTKYQNLVFDGFANEFAQGSMCDCYNHL